MGDAPHDAHERSTPEPPSSEPDTEPGMPPTPTLVADARPVTLGAAAVKAKAPDPSPTSDSVEVSVDLESSGEPARTTLVDGSQLARTTRSRAHSKEAKVAPTGHSSTTLQSMMKPDASSSGVPHTRRFLRIENDLDQTTATVRLLEKRLSGVQKEARVALFVALLALLIAALALAL